MRTVHSPKQDEPALASKHCLLRHGNERAPKTKRSFYPFCPRRSWLQRPLSPLQLQYAVADVVSLISVARRLSSLDCRVVLALSQMQVGEAGVGSGASGVAIGAHPAVPWPLTQHARTDAKGF